MRYPTGRILAAAAVAALIALPAGTAGAGEAKTLSLIKGAGNSAPASQPLVLAQYRGSATYGPAAPRWGPAARDSRYAPKHTYRGYRGYRHHRPGYRRHHDGWWYPSAAFVFGTIIGNALATPHYNYSPAHHRWCDARYRSYRWSDGTFQPYNGPRRRCNSPYDGV